MTKTTAKELSDILKAYSEGKTIQRRGDSDVYFEDVPMPWVYSDISKYEYRIKPETKIVPFTFEDKDLFKDKWIQTKEHFLSSAYKIVRIDNIGVTTMEGKTISYDELLKQYEFDDKTPCGKIIQITQKGWEHLKKNNWR